MSGPYGVGVDAGGNLFLGDGCRVRKVAVSQVITTIAGNGTCGFADNVNATGATIDQTYKVRTDSSGNIFIADGFNHRVRKVDPLTQIITTVAGYDQSLSLLVGLAVDGGGNVFAADTGNNRVLKVDARTQKISTIAGTGEAVYRGDGAPAIAAGFKDFLQGLAFDSAGDLYVADSHDKRIRKLDETAFRFISTVTANGPLGSPQGLAIDASGNLFIADSDNNKIHRVDARTGAITAVAGNGQIACLGGPFCTKTPDPYLDGGPATAAYLRRPEGVAVDSKGNLFIADTQNNRVRKVDATTGIITTVADSLNFPEAIAVDRAGNVFVADTNNQKIQKIDAVTGVMTTYAGTGKKTPDIVVGTTDKGISIVKPGTPVDGPALATTFDDPKAIAVDAAGNVYVATFSNPKVRVIDARTQIITTIAGKAQAVKSVDQRGDNGPAMEALFDNFRAIAVDGAGNVFVNDYDRIRAIRSAR